jgi:hypothetical protein
MKNLEKVIKTGVHTCINGNTFSYEVTNFDMERGEFTASSELFQKIQTGQINPIELSRLLNYLYPAK